MPKLKISTPAMLISAGAILFLVIIGTVFFLSYRFAQNSTDEARRQIVEMNRGGGENFQQVRRVKLTHKDTGESMEIFMDGTVKYYDKNGKLLKTGRRGFAETQNLFRQYEWLINNNRPINGGNYYVEIETQQGVTHYDPGGDGSDDDLIDDTVDFVDDTVNPAPTPHPVTNPTPMPTFSPLPSATATPTPLPEIPDYLNAPPFNCSDYYHAGGKPLKISDIYCGIE